MAKVSLEKENKNLPRRSSPFSCRSTASRWLQTLSTTVSLPEDEL